MQEPRNEWRSPLTGELVSHSEAERHRHQLAGWAPVEYVPEAPAEDVVNHPSHYTQYKGFEVIEITEQLDFLIGNAVKYLLRAGDKDPATEKQDLQKAIWYINRKLNNLA